MDALEATQFTLLAAAPPLSPRAVRAHALKNCLAIVSAVNSLVESELSETAHGWLSRSQNAVRRMLALLEEDLLPESDSAETSQLEFVLAGRVLNTVRDRVEALAATRRVQLHFRVGEGGLRADARGLVEALGNVVMNAIGASPSGGAVSVTSCESADGGQLWTVRDTGPGIPRHDLPHVGVPFFSRRKEGSGLGIAVTREIVERHGGLAQIESEAGSGTLVSIWLPPAPPSALGVRGPR